MTKRKGLSKKLRFEVFKRDSFNRILQEVSRLFRR